METSVRHCDDAEELRITEEHMASGEATETFRAKYGAGHCSPSRRMTESGKVLPRPRREDMRTRAVRTYLCHPSGHTYVMTQDIPMSRPGTYLCHDPGHTYVLSGDTGISRGAAYAWSGRGCDLSGHKLADRGP